MKRTPAPKISTQSFVSVTKAPKNNFLSVKTSLVFFAGILATIGVLTFHANYQLQSPILLQSPVVSRDSLDSREARKLTPPLATPSPTSVPSPTPSATPAPTKGPRLKVSPQSSTGVGGYTRRAYDGEHDINKLVATIAGAESVNGTKGHHLRCVEAGKTNKYGYGALEKFCFDNEEIAELTVYNALVKDLNAGKTLNQTLCEYNTGKATDSCGYLGLIGDVNPYYKNLISSL